MEPELRFSLVSGSVYSCSKFSDETTSDTKFTHSVYSCSIGSVMMPRLIYRLLPI